MIIFSLVADRLLRELIALGVRFRIKEGQLQIRPSRSLTPELQGRIQENRASLMELVENGECWHSVEEWQFEKTDQGVFGTRLDRPGKQWWKT